MSLTNSIEAIQLSGQRVLRAGLFLAICAAAILPVTGAKAATADVDLDSLAPVSDDRLAEMRGGFRFGGQEISFGVVIETVVNGGAAILRTAFNADSVGGPIVTMSGPSVGSGEGQFKLKQAADGGFLLTNDQGTKILHQLGNAGGGIVAAISNSLNGQLIQQQAQLNVGIQNLNTIRGLSVIGSMLNRMGLVATGHAPGL
jgi:hypothetical protein